MLNMLLMLPSAASLQPQVRRGFAAVYGQGGRLSPLNNTLGRGAHHMAHFAMSCDKIARA